MAESLLTGKNIFRIPRRIAYKTNIETLTGARTLTVQSRQYQVLDPGGASRNITLPAEEGNADVWFQFFNDADAAENLVIKDDAASTVVTVPQGGTARVVCTGSAWKKVIDVGTNAAASILGTANVWTGTNEFGVSGTGVDVTFYGDTVGYNLIWDYSADVLRAQDNALIGWGSGAGTVPDIAVKWDGTDLLVTQLTADSIVKWGVSGAGINHVFYGDTATRDMTWDQSNDQLLFADNAKLGIGSGAGAAADITMYWDATKLVVAQLTTNSAIDFGVDGAGIDMIFRGDTASAACTWDQSADSLIFSGVAKLKLQTVADPGTGVAIPVTNSGSIAITTAAAETNTLADPSYMGQTLTLFCDTYAVGNRVVTAASRINQAANTIMTFGAVGDFIKLEAITIGGALKWQVVSNDGVALS